VQAVLQRGDGELIRIPDSSNGSSPTRSVIIEAEEVAVMKSRQGYKGYVIEARSYQQQNGGFSAELWIEEHDASGVTETQFYLPDTFPTPELAIEAAVQAGRQKIDVSFERGSVVCERESPLFREMAPQPENALSIFRMIRSAH